MTTEISVVNVKIMDRDFKVKCPKDKIPELEESASYLNNKMREIHKEGEKMVSLDRIAVITALNIAYDLIINKRQNNSYISTIVNRIYRLQNKVSQALTTEA